jgi:hypothetical protein
MWRSGRKPPKQASKDSADGGGMEYWPFISIGEGRVGIEKEGMAVDETIWSAIKMTWDGDLFYIRFLTPCNTNLYIHKKYTMMNRIHSTEICLFVPAI